MDSISHGTQCPWNRFVLLIEGHLDDGSKKGIIAAWGDQSCDCEWLFWITEGTHHGVLFMPKWLVPLFYGSKEGGLALL
jgi:hypothetical protein